MYLLWHFRIENWYPLTLGILKKSNKIKNIFKILHNVPACVNDFILKCKPFQKTFLLNFDENSSLNSEATKTLRTLMTDFNNNDRLNDHAIKFKKNIYNVVNNNRFIGEKHRIIVWLSQCDWRNIEFGSLFTSPVPICPLMYTEVRGYTSETANVDRLH